MGNLCAQILRARGLRVTVVDRSLRWLGLLYKYDVDTLTELGEPGGYDYFIDTTGNGEMVPDLIDKSGQSAKLLLLGPYRPFMRRVSSFLGTMELSWSCRMWIMWKA